MIATKWAVAAIAATAIEPFVQKKMRGGLVEGNAARGDAYPHMLQAGEIVVPRGSYQDLVTGILAQSGESSSGGKDVNVQIGFRGDARSLLQAKLDSRNALGV